MSKSVSFQPKNLSYYAIKNENFSVYTENSFLIYFREEKKKFLRNDMRYFICPEGPIFYLCSYHPWFSA